MNKKRVLLISNMYPDDKNPSYGIFVKHANDILVSNGYDVTLSVIHKQTGRLKKIFAYLKFVLNNIKLSKKNEYDYIYYHFISHSCIGINKMKIKNAKIIMNAHGNDIVSDDGNKKNIKRSRKYLKFADKVIVPSKYFEQVLIDEYKFDPNKISIYPSGGVDTNIFHRIERTEAFKHFSNNGLVLNKDYKYIGYVSRIENKKGYDILVNAFRSLINLKQLDNYRLLIVGSGSEINRLNALITVNKLEDKVILLPSLPQEELVYLFNILDIFVFPTYRPSESLGLVGLEAFACETLSIISDSYGPSSYIKNNDNCLTFKAGDEQSLINILNSVVVIEDKDKNKITESARNTALEYDRKKTEQVLIKIFEEL